MMKSDLLKSVSLATLFVTSVVFSAPLCAEPSKDTVVAIVNGHKITSSDVEALKKALPEKYQSLPEEKLRDILVRQLVDTDLLDAAAKAAVKAMTADEKKALDHAIAQATQEVVSQSYLAHEIKKAVSNEAIEKAYKDLVDNFPPAEERKLSHILVKDEAVAKAVIKALKGGQDFKKLAQAKSTDTTAQQGGVLGFFRKDQLPEEIGEAAFAIEVGGHTQEPVKTEFGYHVLKVEEKRQAKPPRLEEVQRDIEGRLTQDAIAALLKDLRSKAKIEFFDKEGKPIAEPKPAAPAVKEKK